MRAQDTQPESTLHTRFKADREATVKATEDFLAENPTVSVVKTSKDYRSAAAQALTNGNIEIALQNLERSRDAKSGITMSDRVVNGVSVVIRDARNAKPSRVRSTEAFEMQYLNTVRAALDVVKLGNLDPSLKDDLTQSLNDMARETFNKFPAEAKQEDLAKTLKKETAKLSKVLEGFGVANIYEKLNVAKDFQNFKDKHSNIITLSSVHGRTVVEAEVAMKELTTTQKKEYSNIAAGRKPLPDWYKKMPKWEQGLCKEYASTIAAGQHVIPTQLRQIAGMKNAFEKITALVTNKGKLDELHSSKHAGTLASLARDKNARQGITEENAKQAKEWIGKNAKLHCNTLNAGYIPFAKALGKDDPEIVRRTKDAMDAVGGKLTNTSFNPARYFGVANDLEGAKDTLTALQTSLKGDKDFNAIKSYLQPGFFGKLRRTFGKVNPEAEIKSLQNKGLIDETTAKLLGESVGLIKAVDKADSWIRIGDSENASLIVSTKLNHLTKAIANLESSPKGMDKIPPREEILTMCASGKDRTGLAEHDQSAQVIATALGGVSIKDVDRQLLIKDIDRQLLASGHTAQQAGGINAGGGTIGCYGTKDENRAGLPKSREAILEDIIEQSAQSNKIKGESILKEPTEQEMGPDPIMPKAKATRNNEPEVINQRLEPTIDGESFIYTNEQNRVKPDSIMPKHEVEVHEVGPTTASPGATPKGKQQLPKSKAQNQKSGGMGYGD
jgi:hypothetical protein